MNDAHEHLFSIATDHMCYTSSKTGRGKIEELAEYVVEYIPPQAKRDTPRHITAVVSRATFSHGLSSYKYCKQNFMLDRSWNHAPLQTAQ